MVRTRLEDALEAAHDDIHDAKTRIGTNIKDKLTDLCGN